MSDASFLRLFPTGGGVVDAATFVNGLGLGQDPPPNRPRVLVNMVTTLDGNSTFQGRSAPLSGPGDREMFHALRAVADAILAGTTTLAEEKYGPAGKPVATITRSGRVPTEIPLFQQPEGRAIVFSGSDADLSSAAADVSVETVTELPAVLETLAAKYGVRVLLCEGGPGLLGAVIRAGLADEVFLTLSPNLAGGAAGPSLTTGDPAPTLAAMTLASVLECEGMLFLRYLRTT
jgi:riboflavin biosynthesis pyrimidine reductase